MKPEPVQERWEVIPDFPRYHVSNHGRILDEQRGLLTTSPNNHGHLRVWLHHWDGFRYMKTVAPLVARAFVRVPDRLCDRVIVLDGNFLHVQSWNLAWRPLGFAWEYTHQLKRQHPLHYHNLAVRNVDTGDEYASIIEAGTCEGRLFKDIWRSCNTGDRIYPYGNAFTVTTSV